MGETASVAITSARVYLNDNTGTTWSDIILMPFLQEAHSEMVQELDVNGVGVLKQQTSPITVLAGALNLSANQPLNILEPISMMERNPGEDAEFFQDMIKVNFLPEVDQDEDLVYWTFNQQTIAFLGATQTKEVMLRYRGSITTPIMVTDQIGVIYGSRFLGPRIAALALDSVGRSSKSLAKLAEDNLYKIIQRAVKDAQRPVSRKGYRSAKMGISSRPAGTIGSF